MRLLPALLLLIFAPLAPAAEPLGRLFYTPEQRAQLDALRTQRIVTLQVRDEPVPEIVNYYGIVRRSDGKTTVWVNGEALSEAGLRDKQSISGRISRNGQILLQTPAAGGGGQVQLKVGQSAELLSGRVDESESFAAHRAASAPAAKPAAASKAAAPAPALPPATESASETTAPAENRKTPPQQ
jgi:hypothetical protein